MNKSDIAFILILLFIVAYSFNNATINPSYCNGNTECLLEIANTTKNISLCNLANNSDQCYFKVFLKKKNLTTCSFIKNKSLKETCIIIYSKKDPRACENGTNKKKCYIERAIDKKNVIICNYLKGKDKEYCIYSVAYYTKNISLCNLTSIYKEDCIYMIKNETH